jgi:hypothetical protein
MNVEIETEATQFLCWGYLFRIFGIVSLLFTLQRYKVLEPTPHYLL